MSKICKEEGCENEVRAKGICKYHYNKFWAEKHRGKKICVFSGCKNEKYAKGWCRQHYQIQWLVSRNQPNKNFCGYCGTKIAETAKRNARYCNVKCRNQFIIYGANVEIAENRVIYRNEAFCILTKWKRGLVDPILYLRTIDIYIKIVGFNFNMIKDLNPEKTIKLCLKEIKKIYGVLE